MGADKFATRRPFLRRFLYRCNSVDTSYICGRIKGDVRATKLSMLGVYFVLCWCGPPRFLRVLAVFQLTVKDSSKIFPRRSRRLRSRTGSVEMSSLRRSLQVCLCARAVTMGDITSLSLESSLSNRSNSRLGYVLSPTSLHGGIAGRRHDTFPIIRSGDVSPFGSHGFQYEAGGEEMPCARYSTNRSPKILAVGACPFGLPPLPRPPPSTLVYHSRMGRGGRRNLGPLGICCPCFHPQSNLSQPADLREPRR